MSLKDSPPFTHYDVLGIPSNASPEQIKQAYRAQIKFFHPDVFEGNPEISRLKTLQLNEAYRILSNPQERQWYNDSLEYEAQRVRAQEAAAQARAQQEYARRQAEAQNARSSAQSTAGESSWQDSAAPPPPPPGKKKGRVSGGIISAFVCVFLVFTLGGYILRGLDILRNSSQISASKPLLAGQTAPIAPITFQPAEDATDKVRVNNGDIPNPLTRPAGQRIFYSNGDECIAPLKIVTSGTDDYFIKLRDANTSRTIITFYVRGNSSVDMLVPLGSFELTYACGPTWYGEKLLFWEDTSYHRTLDVFEFYEDSDGIYGWTIELYAQVDGNLESEVMSEDEF